MATIRERSGKLIADFRYMGIRCRETTNLEDNAYNRRILKNVSNSLKLKLLWELLNTKSTFQKVTVLRSLRKKEVSKLLYRPKFLFLKSLLNCGLSRNKLSGEPHTSKRFQL